MDLNDYYELNKIKKSKFSDLSDESNEKKHELSSSKLSILQYVPASSTSLISSKIGDQLKPTGVSSKKMIDIDSIKKKLAQDKQRLERLKASTATSMRLNPKVLLGDQTTVGYQQPSLVHGQGSSSTTHYDIQLGLLADNPLNDTVLKTEPSNLANIRYYKEERMRRLRQQKRLMTNGEPLDHKAAPGINIPETNLYSNRKEGQDSSQLSPGSSTLNEIEADQLMLLPGIQRRRKLLKFLEPGALTRKAQQQAEEMNQLKILRENPNQLAAHQDETTTIKARIYRPKPNRIPKIEWWDLPYVVPLPDASSMNSYNRKSNQTTDDGYQQNNHNHNHNSIEGAGMSQDVDKIKAKKLIDEINKSNDSNNNHIVTLDDYACGKFTRILDELITNDIEHPELTFPPAEPPPPPPMAIMLTRAEQKRINKQNRKRIQDEHREEVLLGIRPPQKGRVRVANMMRVLGEAVNDPTVVERKVIAEMAARVARHEERNKARQLSPEERKAKEKAKLMEDTSLLSHVAVFKVLSLENSRNRFKIDIQANKNLLTGCVLFSTEFGLVIVEGGPKAINRYKKLMLRRIPWDEPNPPPKTVEPKEEKEVTNSGNRTVGAKISPSENKCWLVWEGEVVRRAFSDFRFEATNRPRGLLEKIGVAHYWDLAQNFKEYKI